MQLHPKVQQLKNRNGSKPVMRSVIANQPENTRAKRSESDDPRLIKQYHCIWGIPDDYGTMPIKGCFSKSIKERGPSSSAAYKITALYNHSLRDSVGLPSLLEEDEVGLYSEVSVLPGIQICDELLVRHAAGVCNNGSYGFNYLWDKMDYDEVSGCIVMKEADLLEVSYVTIGSQKETYGVRGEGGEYYDLLLEEETISFIKKVSRKDQLELRHLIDRHITLAKSQPKEIRQTSLEIGKPKHGSLDFDYLIKNFKIL